MEQLSITFLDVGWGDSILLQATDAAGDYFFGLIDSNDTTNWPTTRVFLKRFFERHTRDAGTRARSYPFFHFVAATHAHADHVGGLQGVIRQFGTDWLYTSRFQSANSATAANLLRWAAKATRNHRAVAKTHRYLDKTTTFTLGPAEVSVLWPPPPMAGLPNAAHDPADENNNSLVFVFKLNNVHMVLTGDCRAENWVRPADSRAWPIPLPSKHLKLVQVPHHGARNGLFDAAGGTPLLEQIDELARADSTVDPLIAVSCHPVPHGHPHPAVEATLDTLGMRSNFRSCVPATRWLRTDRNLHYTIRTDGTSVEILARPLS